MSENDYNFLCLNFGSTVLSYHQIISTDNLITLYYKLTLYNEMALNIVIKCYHKLHLNIFVKQREQK